MAKPKLSIIIPTYNRAAYIRDCLESVVSQFKDEDVRSRTEVVISDNGSTDNTAEIVRKFTSQYANIIYSRNETNIGFDSNLLRAIEISSGEYCLPIGDDDAFFPGSFSLMIKKIGQYKFPYFMLNAWGYDHDLKLPVVSHSNRRITADIVYKNLGEFVSSIKDYTELVGNFGGMSQLFLRKAWVEYEKNAEHVGSQANHLFVILRIFKESKFAILAEPIIKTRNNNMRWDTFPGLETNVKRATLTAETVLWISNLYNLQIPRYKVKIHFLSRVYWISLKDVIKKILYTLGVRR